MSLVRGARVCLRAGDGDGGRWVIERIGDGAEVGFVVCEANDEGWFTIRDIELEPGRRGWGYGSEAVRLLESLSVERGWGERFRAGVDARNGLALYFWLRLGYRPAAAEEAFWRAAGDGDMLAMIRTNRK